MFHVYKVLNKTHNISDIFREINVKWNRCRLVNFYGQVDTFSVKSMFLFEKLLKS